MKANVEIKCTSKEEIDEHIAQLKRYGYKRISNCYWFETWQKSNGWTVELERDF